MRYTTALIMAAVGASALPSGHQHAHLHKAAKREDVLVTATIDGKVVSWTQGGSPFQQAHKPTTSSTSTTAAATSSAPAVHAAALVETTTSAEPTPTPAAPSSSSSAAKASPTSSSSSSSSGGSSANSLTSYEPFGSCSSNAKRATTADIAYVGNTGCTGYGSNVKLVDSSIAKEYDYIVKAINDGSSSMECKYWNKIGADGGINGFFTGNEIGTFTLESGGSQYLAFDTNSQGAMCCQADKIKLTEFGEFKCAWLEYDFGSTKNNAWSGFDASALVESAAGPWDPLKVCTEDNSVCSTLDGNGSGTNAYLPGDEALDGIGGNLAPGKVSLISTWS